MAQRAFFAVPGDLSAPTGGYEYARRVLQALPDLVYLPLPGGFPQPAKADLEDTALRLAAVPTDAVLLIDGLALGAMTVESPRAVRAPIVALVHHPLYLETGLSDPARVALRASEQAALSRAAHVIATSASTASLLSQAFGVSDSRLSIAEPGTDPAPRAPRTGSPPHLLAVGAVVPRKGYDLLVRVLAGLDHLPWSLTIAGALDRDEVAAGDLVADIAAHGLTERVALAGAVDAAALDLLYATADIFLIASRHEGYGMAAAQAMARGLPLVASTGGALAATIPDAAAVKYPPDDPGRLRAALHDMLSDAARRAVCAEASWAAGQLLPRWQQTAPHIAEVLAFVHRTHQAMHRRAAPKLPL
jgi:glycosyltransferase involved in cell wall biosynthesis